MRKRILFLALIAFALILPVPGSTGDVEIEDIELKLIEPLPFGRFLAKIWVVNYSDVEYSVSGKLIFYDGDGFEVCTKHFSGKVGAGERVALPCNGILPHYWHREGGYYEAVITSQTPTRR